MKGVVFTEFLDMVEERFSPEIVETIVEEAHLPSGGAYSAVGTYDHSEMVSLVGKLSERTGIPIPLLVRTYGEHLFQRLAATYPALSDSSRDSLSLLESIESFIHPEVLKLYPDAELPRFESKRLGPDVVELVYRSKRPFADLAEGLILGCGAHYGEHLTVIRTANADHSETFVVQRAR